MKKIIKLKDGFVGEKQINIPVTILDKYIRQEEFLKSLYLTHIGFFPKAFFHFRERKKGCADNILFYCLSGKGYFDTPLGRFELNANQYTILPAGIAHRYQADINDPWTIYWIHFSGEKLAALNKMNGVAQYNCAIDIRYNEQIIQLWEQMYYAIKSGYTEVNLGYANLCLYHFLSLFVFPINIERQVEDDLVTKTIRFLKLNIERPLTVENIATHFSYSVSYFSALFKKETGISPIEYFIQLKIHYACQLLDQSPLKIKEIAQKVGYEDAFYFSRQFSKIMGCAPSHYKIMRK